MKDDGSFGAEKPVDEYRAGESHGHSSDFVKDVRETQRKEEVGEKEDLEEEQEVIMKAEEIKGVVVGQEKEEGKYNHVRQLEGEQDGDDDDINDADADADDDEEVEEEVNDRKYESFEVEVAVNS